MASDTDGIQRSAVQDGAVITSGIAPAPSRGPERRLGLALAVISLTQLMLVLDELIVNTALLHIQEALHFSGAGLEWVVTGYAVTFGGLLLIGGRAGDILGRRRMLRTGIAVFTLASLLGGLATLSWQLITARVLQGAGAALAAPAALSLIAVTFPEGRQRTRALGVYAAMTGMGGGVGVIAGGLLTTYASWRWVFFVNVPLGVLLAAGGTVVLMRRFSPGEALGLIGEHRATMFEGVPAMYAMMLAAPDLAGAELGSLRVCTVGGQTIPVSAVEARPRSSGCWPGTPPWPWSGSARCPTR